MRRIINRIVALYRPTRLVMEDLRHFLKKVKNQFPKVVRRVLVRFVLDEIRRKRECLRIIS